MSNLRIEGRFNLWQGLDGVEIATAEPAGLPERRRLLSSGEAVFRETDLVLWSPSLDDILCDAVRPEVGDPSLLHPERYNLVLDELRARLEPEGLIPVPVLAVFDSFRKDRDLLRAMTESLLQG